MLSVRRICLPILLSNPRLASYTRLRCSFFLLLSPFTPQTTTFIKYRHVPVSVSHFSRVFESTEHISCISRRCSSTSCHYFPRIPSVLRVSACQDLRASDVSTPQSVKVEYPSRLRNILFSHLRCYCNLDLSYQPGLLVV